MMSLATIKSDEKQVDETNACTQTPKVLEDEVSEPLATTLLLNKIHSLGRTIDFLSREREAMLRATFAAGVKVIECVDVATDTNRDPAIDSSNPAASSEHAPSIKNWADINPSQNNEHYSSSTANGAKNNALSTSTPARLSEGTGWSMIQDDEWIEKVAQLEEDNNRLRSERDAWYAEAMRSRH